MYIKLEDRKEYTNEFLSYLKKRMIIFGMDYLNKNKMKLLPISNYLKEKIFTGKRKFTAEQIILQGLNNIEFKRINDYILVQINPNVNVPQFDKFKLISICKLIDQGNVEITPFPVFTETFKYVEENQSILYSSFSLGI